ncbi:hypothetical protein MX659_05385 [Coriobacteriia bacterium Es71-Z0120]|uniref:hypothetical protein n=1 Tax=Parvivirga hydrogeniphila TaxID=2939460 RepID=UPI002260CB48|nr:hypothetical protein [Parvivirga hydrogeniphila]MCL4079019.1 hypothetical protein [Parvivirga hydrogeniphila]
MGGSKDASGRGDGSIARAVRIGVATGLAVAVGVIALVGYLRISGRPVPFKRTPDVSRVIVVVALPGEDGAFGAQVISEVDLRSGAIESIDPSMAVSIPGTSYSTLRDAYPFGGGEGVAKALARARGEQAIRYMVLTHDAVERSLAAENGFEVDLPEPMAVFDGERLYEWSAGPVHVSTVSELRAILNGAAYLDRDARDDVLRQIAERAASWPGRYPGGVAAIARDDGIETDLTEDELREMAARLTDSE